MSNLLSRRQFSLSTLAAGAALAGYSQVGAAPPSSSAPKVSIKPYPPVAVTPVPEAFESRYDDLGGVLDLTNGVIWGYEPCASLINSSTNFFGGAIGVNQMYLDLLAMRAVSGTPEENAIFTAAYEIAAQRTWRWPTVFEARDAVAKGLFTFGEGGLNLYFGSPVYEVPAVAYYLWTSRWTSSDVKGNYVHYFSAADGSTNLATKTSQLMGIVVSQL